MDHQLHRRTIATFHAAGYGVAEWQTAIDLLAQATGSRLGELVGWFSPHRAPFRLMTRDVPNTDERLAVWEEIGGADPRVNPLIRAGIRARPMETLRDVDVIGREERRKNVLWNEVFDPCDIPHLGSILLDRRGDSHLVLGVLRTASQGPLVGEHQRLFEHYAGHAATAAAFARKLGEDSGKLLSGSLAGVGAAAIAINRFCTVVGITPAAEALIASERCLLLRGGQLRCRQAVDGPRLEKALGQVTASCAAGDLTISGPTWQWKLDLLPLCDDADLGYNACVLIVIEDVSDLRTLSPAEAEVLALLRRGLRADEIAQQRGVSRETARSQIKAIYAKLGVRDQVELLVRQQCGWSNGIGRP